MLFSAGGGGRCVVGGWGQNYSGCYSNGFIPSYSLGNSQDAHVKHDKRISPGLVYHRMTQMKPVHVIYESRAPLAVAEYILPVIAPGWTPRRVTFQLKPPSSQVSQKSGFLFETRVCFAGTGMCAPIEQIIWTRTGVVEGGKHVFFFLFLGVGDCACQWHTAIAHLDKHLLLF